MDRVERAYRDHGTSLHAFLVRLCGDRDLAEDLMQEAFLRLAQAPRHDIVNVRSWLYRVGTNRYLDLRKVEARRAELLRGTPPEAQEDAQVEEEAGRRNAAQRLQKLLSLLDERDRRLLLLRHAGLKHREIAEVLGTTTASVGTMLARSLQRARQLMQRLDDVDSNA